MKSGSKSNRRGEDSRKKILLSAMRVIDTKGIENATLESIGREAGFTKSQVLYHFPNRRELISSLMRFVIGGMQSANIETLKNQPDGSPRVDSIIKNTFKWARDNPEQLGTYMVYYKMCSTDPDLRASFAMTTEIGVCRIFDSIDRSSKRRMSKETKMRVARAIRHLLVGSIFDFYASNGTTSSPEFDELEIDVLFVARRLY